MTILEKQTISKSLLALINEEKLSTLKHTEYSPQTDFLFPWERDYEMRKICKLYSGLFFSVYLEIVYK